MKTQKSMGRRAGSMRRRAGLAAVLLAGVSSPAFAQSVAVQARPAEAVGTGSASAGSQPEGAAPAAQDGQAPASNDIVVTAQRRAQRLIDVPISITAISGEELESARINNAQDLSFAVPSMSVNEIGGGRQIISIRGLGSERGTSSLTGVYLDEVPLSGLQDGFIATYIDVRPLDLERAEVLKGPQGTLFGEGSVGGTVRFVTRDPSFTSVSGRIDAEAFATQGGDLSGTATGILNLPLASNAGVRIVGRYENNGGWIDRLASRTGPVVENNYNDSRMFQVRAKALWNVTDRLSLRALFVVHRNDGDGSNIVNLEPRSESNFVNAVFPLAPTDFHDKYEIANLSATYDLGFAQLMGSSSYINMRSVASLAQIRAIIPNPNPGFQEVLIPEYSLAQEIYSQEARLTSRAGGPFNWTIGVFYKDAHLSSGYVTGYNFSRFGTVLVTGGQPISQVNPVSDSSAWAVYGDASYRLTDRLEIGGGVRQFWENRDSFNAGAVNPAATRLSGQFKATTYRAYLRYALSEGLRLYASTSTGFRSGGFNTSTVIALGAPTTFSPEHVTAYEAGIKARLLNGALQFEAAAFYSSYDDIQLQTQIRPPNGVPFQYTANPGQAWIKGVEASLRWNVGQGWTLGVSGDITRTRITQVDPNVPNNPVFVGDPIDFVPRGSFSADVTYNFNWGSGLPGYARVDYNLQGHIYRSFRSLDAPQTQFVTPTLHFLNARLGLTSGAWEFSIFGRNLLDEAGALRPDVGITPQARPRTFGMSVGRSF